MIATLSLPAAAQDAETEGSVPTEAATAPLPPLPEPFQPWAPDHRWRSAGMPRALRSVVSTEGGTVLALDRDGTVWRAGSGGRWELSLRGRSDAELDEEDLVLEAEVAVGEVLEAQELDEVEPTDPEEGDELVPEAIEPEELSTETALAEAEARREEQDLPDGRLWADPAEPRRVFLGRGDGLWRSMDAGQSWEHLGRLPPASTLLVDGPELLVGTSTGLWSSSDGGGRFVQVLPGTGQVPVHDLARDGELLLAATDSGLWLREGQGRWTRSAAGGGLPVLDIEVDPNWDGGAWLVSARGLLRTDDRGRSARPASRNPLAGGRRILAMPRAGHLVLVGDDGAWESVDGGTTWQPLPVGLPAPEMADVALWTDRPLAVGPDGAWLLGRAGPVVAQDATEVDRLPELVQVVSRSLDRPGLSLRDLDIGRRVLLARAMPRLYLLGRLSVDDARATSFLDEETRASRGTDWIAASVLCWGNCAVSFGGINDLTELDDLDLDLDLADEFDFAVMGDEVYDLSDATALPSAAADEASEATQYRMIVADSVTKAWFVRRQLAIEAEQVARLPLAEQIDHRLLVEEVEARLDLYTDGWYGRARATTPPSPPPPSAPESP